ncbi:MAG: MmcQ/YjbR family DNA-binding protein [Armatimonadetes bacterium]|nr:MmcQ/YjbR family DNA-binding protein [Armatimonadota bacterium]
MSLERIRAVCLSMPGAVEDHPWGDYAWKVGGKVFCISGESGTGVTVKARPEDQEGLTQDPAVNVAAYVGRFGWVTVDVGAGTTDLAEGLIADSYRLVVAGLPKSKRPAHS